MSVKTKALNEKLADVVRSKPVCVSEDVPLSEALELMRREKASCLTVCRDGKLTGVFTERDFLMKAAGLADSRDPVRRYMTPDPICARLEQTVGEAVEVMNERGIRHLPVVDGKRVPQAVVTVDAVISYLAENFPAAVVNRPPRPHLKAAEMDGA